MRIAWLRTKNLTEVSRVSGDEAMSESNQGGEWEPPAEVVQTLIEFGDEIESSGDLIRDAFEQNLRKSGYTRRSEEVVQKTAVALSKQLEDEDARRVSSALLNYISIANVEVVGTIQDEVSEGVTDLLIDLAVNYRDDVERTLYTEAQGPYFWEGAVSDLVIRQPRGTPGLSHRITVGYSDEVRIDADLDSNLRLARYLIGQEVTALDNLSEQAVRQVNPAVVNDIIEAMDAIQTRLEGHGQGDNSAEGSQE